MKAININSSTNYLQFLTLLLLISVGISDAIALELKEGKWGITTEITTPMASEPVIEYEEECVEGSFNPMAELLDEEMGACEILSNEDSANRLEVTMQCTIPNAGTMDGKILFEVDGDSALGQMDMTMNMGGMTMNMGSTWSGEYLGACSQ